MKKTTVLVGLVFIEDYYIWLNNILFVLLLNCDR